LILTLKQSLQIIYLQAHSFSDIEARTNPHIEKLEFQIYDASVFHKDGWKLMLTDFSKCLPNLQILTYEQSWYSSFEPRDDENDGEDDVFFFKHLFAC
jgi:hypothetical protein